MADRVTSGTSTDAALMSEAFSVARELLQRAEEDAARIRADADRYVRQREQEAELLVGKARRLLEIAEQTAASIAVGPRHMAPDDGDRVIDLDAEAAVGRRLLVPESLAGRSDLDRLLAAAVAKAFDDTFPIDP